MSLGFHSAQHVLDSFTDFELAEGAGKAQGKTARPKKAWMSSWLISSTRRRRPRTVPITSCAKRFPTNCNSKYHWFSAISIPCNVYVGRSVARNVPNSVFGLFGVHQDEHHLVECKDRFAWPVADSHLRPHTYRGQLERFRSSNCFWEEPINSGQPG